MISLALLWHQHQPYYPDDVTGENPMPWVRLHGVKDYYGMALHLLEVPQMRCTVNLVPSLLVQLEAYTERGASDQFLDMARKPARGLSEADALFLLDHFFMAQPDGMIRPHPRYFELYGRRALGRNTAREALRRFQPRDLLDLQVWFNLAWVHPLAVDRDEGLRALRDKGRGYTEADKAYLLDKHLEILREVIPLHRRLQESGQVELTTTPFYHPILPLLLDKKLAREAMPDVKLPRFTGGYPDDAGEQVRQAVDYHTRLFGRPPAGMWPAEGSVCQAMVPLVAEHGFGWMASDEGVLAMSTRGFVGRDARGHVRNPDALYRPYRVEEGGRSVAMVFRDHALSDAIGFHYQRSEAAAAADDFVARLKAIRAAVKDPPLVSVILDGENCWEYYPGGGVAFLRALYERCTRTPGLRPVTVGEYLRERPPADTLPRLAAGSWIHNNFAIWIGHEEDNAGWDAVHRAREHLTARAAAGGVPAERLARAWRELYIAEGSDWYWWFGDDHSSAQDALFDALFRKHVRNVYELAGGAAPPELDRPISRHGHRASYTLPNSFLAVTVDGRRTFFEWAAAGRYSCQNERGAMAQAWQGPLRDVFFGFDEERLFVRVDCDRPARQALLEYDALRLGFAEPSGVGLVVERPGRPDQAMRWEAGVRVGETMGAGAAAIGAAGVEAAADLIVEAAVPFETLAVAVGGSVQFYVELVQGGQVRDRAPREGAIALTRPSADFERIMWDV